MHPNGAIPMGLLLEWSHLNRGDGCATAHQDAYVLVSTLLLNAGYLAMVMLEHPVRAANCDRSPSHGEEVRHKCSV